MDVDGKPHAHVIEVAIIGGGPAGLRAAEIAAGHGLKVTVFDSKPSVGRKFLVAGKGGMNLTHSEPPATMAGRYSGTSQPPGVWQHLLAGFDSAATRHWALELGQETFQSSSGRVYLKSLKSAPLLRSWIARLKELGVQIKPQHEWTQLIPGKPHQLEFSNETRHFARAVVLALGGASWPRTGSDGKWLSRLTAMGISCEPLQPANCGWVVNWPAEIIPQIEGKPLKNLQVTAMAQQVNGELMLTRYGLEGGALYALGATLRQMPQPEIVVDLKPTFSTEQLLRKMESVRGNFLAAAQIRWKLPTAAVEIFSLQHWPNASSLASAVKSWRIPLTGPRPIAEAISSAGGVNWSELDDSLMVKSLPGVFVAGEMIDWEAPTGGFLLQGCLTTGTLAGKSAANWVVTPD